MEERPPRELRERLAAPRVAVLGPVAVGPVGSPQRVAGLPARLLVALAAATRPLDVSELSDLVWRGTPPATHRSALHVHLGSVRQLLTRVGDGCRIQRTAEGYRLDRDGWELDSRLAVDLGRAASASLDSEPALALELAEEALRLHRGAPFTVEGETVHEPSRRSAEATRRELEELVVEALLATDQAGRAETAALRGLDAEPLRELRWGQLLRARYLAGRTAEAIATFQDARATLGDALGIEPGPDLRELEAAALTHDAERLRLHRRAEPAVPGAPNPPSPIVGREREVERIGAAVATGRRIALLGPPGVGKSRTAIEVARRVGSERVAWIDLREHDGERRRTLVGNVADWARRHPDGLLVIDNAEAAGDDLRVAVAELARAARSLATIVTSRVPIDGATVVEGLRPLAVPSADADDPAIEAAPAVRLLRTALSELAPAASVSTGEAAQLVAHASGLPLLIRLSAAAARAVPAEVLVARAPSVAGDDIDVATRAVVAALEARAKRAFVDLAALASEFDADMAARVTDLGLEAFTQVILELVDHGLVEARPDRPLTYTMLEPIRAAGQRMLCESGRHPAVLDRHVDACIDRARLLPQPSEAAGADLEERVALDLPEHRRALEHLVATGDAARALELVCRLEGPLYALGWWPEKVELLDLALAIDGPPSPMRARAHAFRARPGPMHLFDLDHADRAISMARALGHERLAAYAEHLRSIGLWWRGDAAEAVELAASASDALAAADLVDEWCEARKFLGVALVFDGQPDAGLDVQREVLDVVRARGRPFNVAHNLAYLGHCHRMLGDDVAARADLAEAGELCRRVGNRGTAIHVAIALGEIAADEGDHRSALERAGEALDLAREARTVVYEPWAWTVAMRAHGIAGDRAAATTCAWRAVEGLAAVPPGETVRLATELAQLALDSDDVVTAARLLGVIEATPDRRELPFPAPAERERHHEVARRVTATLGDRATEHRAAGARCTVPEAAATLLVSSL